METRQNIISKEKLTELADILIEDIKNKKDVFETTTIIVPSKRTSEWFKAYWLKSNDDVLMNVNFQTFDEFIPSIIITSKKYNIVNRKELRSFIINVLANNSCWETVNKYIYENNAINGYKLFDIANELSKLYTKYENEMIEITGYQSEIYTKVLELLDKNNHTTIKGLFDKKTWYNVSKNQLYFFGFSEYDPLPKTIIDEYSEINPIKEFKLKLNDNSHINFSYSLFSANSKEREVINVHTMICKAIQEGNYTYSDFLVLSPDISEYESLVSRIFKQDDVLFPNIPYSISSNSYNNDLYNGISILYRIIIKGYFTRFDVIELLNNKIIMSVMDITYDDIDVYLELIAKMNIYRDRCFIKDWEYAKKTILLSKIVNINQIDDNVINLGNRDYIPYSNISLNDDLIIKFIELIDDLYNWIKLFKDSSLTQNTINELIDSLNKWFYVSDTESKLSNKELSKVIRELYNWIDYDFASESTPLLTLLQVILDISSQKSVRESEMFTRGITFANYDEKSILSSKYIFFIGFNSKSFPKKDYHSELDITNNIQEESYDNFKLQVKNATKKVIFSYVNKNLKTDEDYFLSKHIIKFYNENNIDEQELQKQEVNINLDETRAWHELYTKKEFNDKNYYVGLFNNNEETNSVVLGDEEKPKKISISKMKDFLNEPLKFRAEYLFIIYDSIGNKLDEELEPFDIDKLTKSIMIKHLIKTKIERNEFIINSLEEVKNILKTYIDSNLTGIINSEYLDYELNNIITKSGAFLKYLDSQKMVFKIKSLNDYCFELDNEMITICVNDSILLSVNGNTRTYIELKPFKKTEYSECMKLYLDSLVEIASLEDDEVYNVGLIKGPLTKFTYSITSSQANVILKKIYLAMFDNSMNKFLLCKYAKDSKLMIKSYNTLVEEFEKELTYGSWQYYKDSKLFTSEMSGYTEENYTKEFNDMIDTINDLVLMVKPTRGKKND